MEKRGHAPAVLCLLLLTGAVALRGQALPDFSTTLFAGSGVCEDCHGSDPGSMRTPSGEDISPVSHWRSSMMANAVRDPLWRAKVSAEISANPQLQQRIEHKCATCHLPVARTQALFDGDSSYALSDLIGTSRARDGVNCSLCHQIQPDSLGHRASFTGKYRITDERRIFGPYEAPDTHPMQMHVGYTPVHSEHIHAPGLCGACHTLYTSYTDTLGVEREFPEQTPYLEWLASKYPADSVTCQQCHLPRIEGPAVISNYPPGFFVLRQPLYRHDFVGANTLIPAILRDNAAALGVVAGTEYLDLTLQKARERLARWTAELTAGTSYRADTLFVDVRIRNLAGHKFPTGYPARRAWLHLTVADSAGNLVFESGALDESGEIIGLDQGFEPHHDVISEPGQVQVYQAVMGDPGGEPTHTLLEAASYLKDNRIPPAGFRSSGENYEDIAVRGGAARDPDFNRSESGEDGTGSDLVNYRIPVQGDRRYVVSARLLYQQAAPRFIDDLFSYETPQVEAFRGFYSDADTSPAAVDSLTLDRQAGENSVGVSTDVNADGATNIFDLLEMLRVLSGKSGTPAMIRRSDLNDDGRADVFDLLLLLEALSR